MYYKPDTAIKTQEGLFKVTEIISDSLRFTKKTSS